MSLSITGKEFGPMEDERPYIDFNILLIKELKERYEENLKFIKEMLPVDINLNSPKQIKSLLEERLEMIIDSVTIVAIEGYRDLYEHDSEEFDLCNGLVLYLKQKFTVNNYLNCILKHHENGRVYLRHEQGAWVLPNKRPISESPEIRECVTATHIPKEKTYGSKVKSKRKR